MRSSGRKMRMSRAAVMLTIASGLLAICAAGAAAAPGAAKDDANPHLWKPRVKSVAVFKNGLGFFLREGEVSLREGWCASKEIPPAAFGTLAIFAHDKRQVVDIVGSGSGEVVDFDDVDAPNTLAAKRARLEAAAGLNLQLTYKDGTDTRSAAGKLLSIGPEFVILQNKTNNFAVPLASVTRMKVLDLPIRVHVSAEDGKVPEKSKLAMAYLRKGITWIPEYTLKILDANTAEMTLRGTLVNEAEDLIHCDVSFVVGVPHFVHTRYMAPIAVGQMIRTIGGAVLPRRLGGQIMNRAAMVSNLRTSPQFGVVDRPVSGRGGDVSKALGNLPQMAGPGGSDYTVYTKKNLTVRRGEKAIVTLFTKRVKYSHVYRWSPPGRMKHLLVLHNSTDTAWTTGPCLVISNGSPLSEDLLKYVPKGGSGEIPVTTAINIAHEKTESETERKLKAHTPAHNFFLDLVTLEGKLTLKNFEKRAALVIINVTVPGKPLKRGDGDISVDTRKLKLLERTGSVHWEIKLEPGEKKTLTYSYERYVPSR